MVAEVARIRLRHELDCALWGVEAESYRREQEAESWLTCQAAVSASVSWDSGQERARRAARATSRLGTCGGTRCWQAALRRRRRSLATGRVCLSHVSSGMSRRCAECVEGGVAILPDVGFVGRAALRLCVAVAFGLGLCLTPERVCGLRGLRARRVGGRRVCVARCGMGSAVLACVGGVVAPAVCHCAVRHGGVTQSWREF